MSDSKLDSKPDEVTELSNVDPADDAIPASPKPKNLRKGPLLGWLLILAALAFLFVFNLVQMRAPEPEDVAPARTTPALLSAEQLEAEAQRKAEEEEAQQRWALERREEMRPEPPPSEPPKPFRRRASTRPRVETPKGVEMPSGLVPAGVPAPRPPAPRAWTPPVPPRASGWAEVEAPRSRGPVLRAGTFVPARLLTPVTSESAGPRSVLAMVSHDVRDATHRHVVIPVGSRLLGRLVGDVSPGRERAVIAWDRLDLPDGRVFDLGGTPSTAADGSAGVPGEVDHHWRALYGHAFLTSLLGGLARVSQQNERGVLDTSTGEVFSAGVGRELTRVTQDVVERVLRRPSTIEIPRGQRVAILVTRDVTFGGA